MRMKYLLFISQFMDHTKKTSDTFFYFFAAYSALFIILDYFGSLLILQVLTYLGLLLFFCFRLNTYFSYMLENRWVLDKKRLSKNEKEIYNQYMISEEIFKQWVIILLLTLCFFVAIGNSSKYTYQSVPLSSTEYQTSDTYESVKVQDIESMQSETITDPQIEEIPIIDSQEIEKDLVEETTPNEIAIISDPVENAPQGSDLILEKNLQLQVKDVYSLTPFTKDGSDFFNIMQLQRVLQKLGYYDGIADGNFNLEMKAAIATVLVEKCNWPADKTLWVFWVQAKACIDNLYISVDEPIDS